MSRVIVHFREFCHWQGSRSSLRLEFAATSIGWIALAATVIARW